MQVISKSDYPMGHISMMGKVISSVMPGTIRAAPMRRMLPPRSPHDHLIPLQAYIPARIPLAGVAHQNGTVRFGRDPRTSVLDQNCRAHDVDNLDVVDASFFPSSGAVNPALTIMANALRVGDHLLERMR